jgi:hypothetical protein
MLTCPGGQIHLRSVFWRSPDNWSPEAGKRSPGRAHRPMRAQVRASLIKPPSYVRRTLPRSCGPCPSPRPSKRKRRFSVIYSCVTHACVRLAKMGPFSVSETNRKSNHFRHRVPILLPKPSRRRESRFCRKSQEFSGGRICLTPEALDAMLMLAVWSPLPQARGLQPRSAE